MFGEAKSMIADQSQFSALNTCILRSLPRLGLAAVVALLPACEPALAQFAGNVVRIGVLTDMEGAFSENTGAGAVLAVQMAVDDFGGKVAGKPIEVIFADHQNKPDIASTIARNWYDLQNVDL